MTDSTVRKPGIAFYCTLSLVLLFLLYPVSFGPAIWSEGRGYIDKDVIERVYAPMLWGILYGPPPVCDSIYWWAALGLRPDHLVCYNVDDSREGFVFFGLPAR